MVPYYTHARRVFQGDVAEKTDNEIEVSCTDSFQETIHNWRQLATERDTVEGRHAGSEREPKGGTQSLAAATAAAASQSVESWFQTEESREG